MVQTFIFRAMQEGNSGEITTVNKRHEMTMHNDRRKVIHRYMSIVRLSY